MRRVSGEDALSTSVVVNGTTYSIPASGETDWATSLSAFLAALASASSSILVWSADALGAATTYLRPGNSASADANELKLRMPRAGKLSALTAATVGAPAGGSTIVTVRVNGVDTALTATIVEEGYQQDLAHTVTVAANAAVSVKVTYTGTPPTYLGVTLAFTPS